MVREWVSRFSWLASAFCLLAMVSCRPGAAPERSHEPVAVEESSPYVKLGPNGEELPGTAASWLMVRERKSGLVWEMKSEDGSIHDMNNLYKWVSAKEEFLGKLNGERFGGFDDWRMPSEEELKNLLDFTAAGPTIDPLFFPHTAADSYWSLNVCGDGNITTPRVDFGKNSPRSKSNEYRVRAVRGGVPK